MQIRKAKRAPVRKGQTQKVPAQAYSFAAPMRGWILDENLMMAQPGGARVLDNWIPTQRGARVRGGCVETADIGTQAVRAFFPYNNASPALFAATPSEIVNIDITTDRVEGFTSGEWSGVQFGTSGGDYIVAVNGADFLQLYNSSWSPVTTNAVTNLGFDGQSDPFAIGETLTGGTSGATATIVGISKSSTTAGTLRLGPVTGTFSDNEAITGSTQGAALANGTTASGSAITITGVATNTLSAVWSYASRLFFVERNSLSAWYLSADSVGGAATELPLAGLFDRGGSLVFGARWSLDSGDGLDDKCVFVTNQGEVAIYQGADPGDASWKLVGLYRMPKPLGKRAFVQSGGDLLIATQSGLIPISAAVRADMATIEQQAISRPIETYWRSQSIALTSASWDIVKSEDMGVFLVTQPDDGSGQTMLAADLVTRAWSRITGWDAQSVVYHQGNTYFGSSDGKVYQGDITGADDGEIYTASYLGSFESLGFYGQVKTILQARALFEVGTAINPQVTAAADFNEALPAPPNALSESSSSLWDVAKWDENVWDGGRELRITSEWSAIGITGVTLAPIVQLTFGSPVTPQVNLIAIDAQFHTGAFVA